MTLLRRSIEAWTSRHRPEILYARDSIHDPLTLEAFFTFFKQSHSLKTGYILTHIVGGRKSAEGSGNSLTYKIKETSLKGFMDVVIGMGGQNNMQ